MEHIQKNAGRARRRKACPSAWPADRARFSKRSACATACLPVKWANLPSRTPGVDHDIYDPYCEHLVVRDTQAAKSLAPTVSWPRECPSGRLLLENEFDLTRLQHLRSAWSRSAAPACIRITGPAAITLLWSGLAQYMTERGYDYLMGCASISMADGGHAAASLYNRLAADHLGPQEYRVFPRCPLPLAALQRIVRPRCRR
jgi:putative hemolysin